jgi:hypothetical protein
LTALTPEEIDRIRESWRELHAGRGSELEKLLILQELLPGRAAEELSQRRTERTAGAELDDAEIIRLASLGETPIPYYLGWGVRIRDGRVELMRRHDGPSAPSYPTFSGRMSGHALRSDSTFSWWIIAHDPTLEMTHHIADRVVAAIAERYPSVEHEAIPTQHVPDWSTAAQGPGCSSRGDSR